MAAPIRVLILEDRPADVDLLLHELRRAGFEPDWKCVETEADFLVQLQQDYDVVLADYSLPQFDGPSALRLLQVHNPDLPFIVVTGSISEEVAVECMKQGAADYLLKDRLTRLGVAVAHALQERRLNLEKRQAEVALRENEALFRLLIENISDVIMVLDGSGIIRYVSPSAERVLGYPAEEWGGQGIAGFIHPDDGARLQAACAGKPQSPGTAQPTEIRFRHRDGSWHTLEAIGSKLLDDPVVAGSVVTLRDVTERKQLEDQLRQSQKMEAIGRLAGGIAHDFNNLLVAILGYSDLLLDNISQFDPLREDIEEIKKAGGRAAALTRQLLAFSRKQVLQPQMLDLNTVVVDMGNMLRRLIGENIELTTILAPEIRTVQADPGQIGQVLMNLVVNAREAMLQGGQLTIETANIDLDEGYARRHIGVRPGPHVMLAVSDTGAGMDEEVRSHLFEPFFTTKRKSTGMGLPIVYGIVQQSGGHIKVSSDPGRGTVFRIYLPQARAEVGAADWKPAEPAMTRGSETILLVEDDDGVRTLAYRILSERGYAVLEASRPDEALRIGGQYRDPIHLLVSDVVMPGMSGCELVDRLALLHPEMKVLYVSGYTDDVIIRHGVLGPETVFLQKPFTPAILAHKVRQVLDTIRPEQP